MMQKLFQDNLALIVLGLGILLASGVTALGSYIAIIGCIMVYRKFKGDLW